MKPSNGSVEWNGSNENVEWIGRMKQLDEIRVVRWNIKIIWFEWSGWMKPSIEAVRWNRQMDLSNEEFGMERSDWTVDWNVEWNSQMNRWTVKLNGSNETVDWNRWLKQLDETAEWNCRVKQSDETVEWNCRVKQSDETVERISQMKWFEYLRCTNHRLKLLKIIVNRWNRGKDQSHEIVEMKQSIETME